MQQLYEDTFGEAYVRAAAANADTAHSGVAAVSYAHFGVAAPDRAFGRGGRRRGHRQRRNIGLLPAAAAPAA
jgi:hypothetical protein